MNNLFEKIYSTGLVDLRMLDEQELVYSVITEYLYKNMGDVVKSIMPLKKRMKTKLVENNEKELWAVLMEALKALKTFEEEKCKEHFEELVKFSHRELYLIYLSINRTKNFNSLMDYAYCAYKLKYKKEL